MDLISIITAIIGLVTGGGITAFVYFPQIKRNKELLNRTAELENEQKVIEQWKELYQTSEDGRKAQSAHIDRLYGDLKNSRHQNNDLRAENTALQIFKCENISCQNRIPPIGSSTKKD